MTSGFSYICDIEGHTFVRGLCIRCKAEEPKKEKAFFGVVISVFFSNSMSCYITARVEDDKELTVHEVVMRAVKRFESAKRQGEQTFFISGVNGATTIDPQEVIAFSVAPEAEGNKLGDGDKVINFPGGPSNATH